jgi:hypothetical protein
VTGLEQLELLLSDIQEGVAVVERWEVPDDNPEGDEEVEHRLEGWEWCHSCKAAASQVAVVAVADHAIRSRGGARVEVGVDAGVAERVEELADLADVLVRWRGF